MNLWFVRRVGGYLSGGILAPKVTFASKNVLEWSGKRDSSSFSICVVPFFVFVDFNSEVGLGMLKWVYTDQIDIKNDDTFLLELLKASSRFKLTDLRKK